MTSYDVQQEICAALAKSNGLVVLDERFDDHGWSGANLRRPALQRLLALVRTGAVRAVVVHRLDRLSRRVTDCAALMNEFKDLGVRLLVAAVPELAETASDTLLLNLMSCFAEFEREMIASRIEDRRVGLIAHNQRIAGRTPFGYSAHPRTKQLVPVPNEAAIVREIFGLVADGMRPSEVARFAAERGWRTRSGRHWTARQVLDTISNSVYVGQFGAGNQVRPGCHEAIVRKSQFERCAAMTATRRTAVNGARRMRPWSVLQRKVRCARCRQLMSIHVNSRGSRRYLSFRCRRTGDGKKPCRGTQVAVFEVEQRIESIFCSPADAVPKKRGRPPRWSLALRSLREAFPTLDLAKRKQLIGLVVEEIVWDADSRQIQVILKKAAILEALPQLEP